MNSLERQPYLYVYDHAFTELTDEIEAFVASNFDNKFLEWYNDPIPEVLEKQKDGLVLSSTRTELKWLQHRAKMNVLAARFQSYGLHPDIQKRDPSKYGRYNVILEYRSLGSTKVKKECKTMLSREELEQLVLQPHRGQKPSQLNGKFFAADEIVRIRITRTVMNNEEARLYKEKYRCYSNLALTKRFEEVTDTLIINPHLEDDSEKNTIQIIDRSRIDALKAYTGTAWDLQKLIKLCEELNSNAEAGNFYAIAYLSRALIDHVPPILGCKNFDEVANNYAGSKSFKKAMEPLSKTLKNLADMHIHTQVSAKLASPSMTQVNFSQALDLLLGEIIKEL